MTSQTAYYLTNSSSTGEEADHFTLLHQPTAALTDQVTLLRVCSTPDRSRL